jgi:hypothetical protein
MAKPVPIQDMSRFEDVVATICRISSRHRSNQMRARL